MKLEHHEKITILPLHQNSQNYLKVTLQGKMLFLLYNSIYQVQNHNK